MSDIIWVGLISGAVGVIGVLVPALRAIRNQPTRRTTDAITLVDASGTVIGNLTDEINRLDTDLDEARQAAKLCIEEVRVAKAELATLAEELKRRPTRDELLDANGKLRRQLIDLGETPINGPPPIL